MLRINGRMLRRLLPNLTVISTAAVSLTVINVPGLLESIQLATNAPEALCTLVEPGSMTIPMEPYLLTSGLLTVGLVFRANQSLERYNRGRDAWVGASEP